MTDADADADLDADADVWTASGSRRHTARACYHVDRDCQYWPQTPQRWDREDAEAWGIEPCDDCVLGKTDAGGGPAKHLKSIQQHVISERGEDPFNGEAGRPDVDDADPESDSEVVGDD